MPRTMPMTPVAETGWQRGSGNMVNRSSAVIVVGLAVVMAATTGATGQDASVVMAAARTALGGEARLGAVRNISVTGRTLRLRSDDTTAEHPFEMAFEAPSRFVRRSVAMAMGPTSIYRHSGFDGVAVIDWMDTPPSLAGGGNVVIRMNWQTADGEAGALTPEQTAERNAQRLEAHRREFARLSLGLFAAAPAAYPLQFRHVGHAESPDGRADVIEATGPNGVELRLFIDSSTHLPLMVSWQAPEAIEIRSEDGPGGVTRVVRRFDGGPATGEPATAATPGDRALVEHRLTFSDFRTFDGGVRLPTRLQLVVAGRTTEETVFERVRINTRLDGRTFATGN